MRERRIGVGFYWLLLLLRSLFSRQIQVRHSAGEREGAFPSRTTRLDQLIKMVGGRESVRKASRDKRRPQTYPIHPLKYTHTHTEQTERKKRTRRGHTGGLLCVLLLFCWFMEMGFLPSENCITSRARRIDGYTHIDRLCLCVCVCALSPPPQTSFAFHFSPGGPDDI